MLDSAGCVMLQERLWCAIASCTDHVKHCYRLSCSSFRRALLAKRACRAVLAGELCRQPLEICATVLQSRLVDRVERRRQPCCQRKT